MKYGDNDAIYRSATEGFADLADTYDSRMAGNPVLLLESTATLTSLPIVTDAVVADFGCGTGRYALQLARLGANKVIGIDIAPEMLACASRKARRAEDDLPVTWIEADLTDIPVAENTFDIAVCALVVSFLTDPQRAITEMVRTLKPGGCLILSDYHPQILLMERTASLLAGRNDKAPYLRFTTADGEECRIRQYPYTIADLFTVAHDNGLILEHVSEPLADRRLANTYYTIRDKVGLPLTLVMRFRKERS